MKNILLLHGALGSKEQLASLRQLLMQDFKVYDLNFDGHGGASGGEAFTTDLFTQNVVDFLATHHIEKVSIFGYSMGGYVGLNVARMHPEKVEKVVTYGTKFAWTKDIAAKEVRMLNPEKIEAKVPAFAQQLKATHAPNSWKEVLHKTAQMMTGLGENPLLTTERLEQIPHKAMIVVGEKDHMVSVDESQHAAASLPKGELKKVEDFQHMIERNDPTIMAEILKSFIG